MEIFFNPAPKWAKQGISILGLLIGIGGLGIGFVVLLLVLIMAVEDDPAAITVGLFGSSMTLLMVGTGVATFWHSVASMEGKLSKPFRLPAIWKFIVLFCICVILGWFVFQGGIAPGIFLPPILLIASLLPPLVVLLLWRVGDTETLTWRRCLIVFCWGTLLATSAVLVTQVGWLIITEFFLDSAVVSNLFASTENESAVGFFVHMTLVVPIASLLAAPLVTLPWLRRFSQRDAFLLGSISGAALAGVSTVILISIEPELWLWVLILQTMGCAVLPLGTGLVTLGWQRVVLGGTSTFIHWLALFGTASATYILWNAGLIIVLGAIGLEPVIPMGNLGAITLGLAVVTLVVLGVIYLWAGKWLADIFSTSSQDSGMPESFLTFASANQVISVWALACIIALVPAGLIIVQFL